jgi:hypothetical protein
MTHDCNWKKAKVRQGSIRTCRRCRDWWHTIHIRILCHNAILHNLMFQNKSLHIAVLQNTSMLA